MRPKRTLFLLIVLSLAVLTMTLAPRQAAAQWADIDCRASRIAVDGAACRQGPSDPGDRGRCNFKRFMTFGTRDGLYFEAYLYVAEPLRPHCWVYRLEADRLEQLLKAIAWVKSSDAQDFAPTRVFQDGLAQNFAAGSRRCSGYYLPGPAQGSGLVFHHRGFVCGAENRSFDDTQMITHLRKVKIVRYD